MTLCDSERRGGTPLFSKGNATMNRRFASGNTARERRLCVRSSVGVRRFVTANAAMGHRATKSHIAAKLLKAEFLRRLPRGWR